MRKRVVWKRIIPNNWFTEGINLSHPCKSKSKKPLAVEHVKGRSTLLCNSEGENSSPLLALGILVRDRQEFLTKNEGNFRLNNFW